MTSVRLALIALALALVVGEVQAQGDAVSPPLLNKPSAGWAVFGPGQTTKPRRDSAVQGGMATRVTIASKPANSWDIGASLPISGGIAKGDKLVLAFWVRIADVGDGSATLGAAIQQNSAPFAPIISGRLTATTDWQLVHIKGIASADYSAGTANIGLTLGDGARVIDLGPAFVIKSD